MPVVPTQDILQDAFRKRYGVPAINIVNDLTMEAVLAAAEEEHSPLIVQTSVKTIRMTGLEVMFAMWTEMTRALTVPVALHLDHCPEREVITACLARGWNSVLFDASALTVDENKRQCIEVVAEARRVGAAVEGEIEGIRGVEDDIGSDAGSATQQLDVVLDFITGTGVDCFAPAIGNAHGVYRTAPQLDSQRVSDIVAAAPIPIALHGGSGLGAEQFRDLISRGCAKVNISTALKIAFMRSGYQHMADNPGKYDPPSQFRAQRAAVMAMAREHMQLFGSAGRA
ncbi:MAG TPA: class II fructose-bisphosphate aldolase [Candidatus Limnocylindria bacterium]